MSLFVRTKIYHYRNGFHATTFVGRSRIARVIAFLCCDETTERGDVLFG